jgi:beta-phosphoglucomutase
MASSAVIFDVDGVLVDSYRAHFASWAALYREMGRDYTETAFATDFGRTSRDILRRTLGHNIPESQIRHLDERKEALYRERLRKQFPAMDGAVELIDALVADGFLLAVGSSAPRENIALSLDELSRGARFAAIVSGEDVTCGKPDPHAFQLAAQRLGVPPARCAVVEDAVHGIEAARRAGMAAIALTGTATREQFSAADLVVDGLRELSPQIIRALINGRSRVGQSLDAPHQDAKG